MTSPNQPAPDGGRSYEQVAGLRTVKVPGNIDQGLYDQAETMRGSFLGNILSGFGSVGQAIGSLLEDLVSAFFGDYEGSNELINAFQDGQLALNKRVELLGDNGYCSMIMDKDYYVSNGNLRALPFSYRVGPMNHATPVVVNRQHPGAGTAYRDEHCIRLDRKGLWQVNVAMLRRQSEWESFAEIVVLKPDLTPYTYVSMPTPRGNALGSTGDEPPSKGAPISLFKMFVIPEPGYYVQVRFMGISGGIGNLGRHGIRGGAKYSQFAVTQWSSDIGNGNAPDDPVGTIED